MEQLELKVALWLVVGHLQLQVGAGMMEDPATKSKSRLRGIYPGSSGQYLCPLNCVCPADVIGLPQILQL